MLTKKIAFGDNFATIFSGWKTSSMIFQIPYHKYALVAQLVEHVLGKDEVTGSIPVEGSSNGNNKEDKNG